ncbi:unnamed protein product [Caenorhabditis auriculariae]|uniref:Hflx-type G domain-containing protein n=1 Tax=Caenorhabditis auriculariae TaxID=2777116 RepID=A0A8S1HDB2_9PELO|nr:unnamed protein product [Caenorhabditis auriculariae]
MIILGRATRRFCRYLSTASESISVFDPTTANVAGGSYSVLIVHPKVRWGSFSPSVLKNADRQLEEAVTLVNTLPYMVAVDSLVVPVDYNTKRKGLWPRGRTEKLLERREQVRATALMINVEMLSPMQQEELYRTFGVPVFDRYNIVMSIFKAYAKTEEARLQIALAELPYIRNRLNMITSKRTQSPPSVFHVQQTFADHEGTDLHESLRKREQELRKRLKECVEKGEEECAQTTSGAALVAVVGYTNAGKTSLVKKLTGAESLQPQDRLFATLDTTRHQARLPSGRSVVFADTIGFLSDLPTNLIAAFQATLSHVKFANVIVHLRDVSHADWRAQDEDVVATLKRIGISEKASVVTVDNKIDKDGAAEISETDNDLRVSCANGEGLEQFIRIIDEKVLEATKCKKIKVKLKADSPLIEYLYREKLVNIEPEVDEDSLTFEIYVDEAQLSRFRAKFNQLKAKNDLS